MIGLCLLATSGVSLAQPPGDTAPEETGAVITTFADVPWGAGETTVREKHGEPWGESVKDTSHPGGPWRVLLYDGKILGRKATFLFGIQQNAGLVQGLVWLREFKPDRCEAAFEEVRDYIQEQYPGLEAQDSRYNKSPYLDFCQAVRLDLAARSTRWTDPVSGTSIELTINDHASMTAHVVTPEFARYQGEESSP